MTEFKKPVCTFNIDGNVFSIIGNVQSTLRKAGFKEKAAEFRDKALSAKSYDEVIQLSMQYVDFGGDEDEDDEDEDDHPRYR